MVQCPSISRPKRFKIPSMFASHCAIHSLNNSLIKSTRTTSFQCFHSRAVQTIYQRTCWVTSSDLIRLIYFESPINGIREKRPSVEIAHKYDYLLFSLCDAANKPGRRRHHNRLGHYPDKTINRFIKKTFN